MTKVKQCLHSIQFVGNSYNEMSAEINYTIILIKHLSFPWFLNKTGQSCGVSPQLFCPLKVAPLL